MSGDFEEGSFREGWRPRENELRSEWEVGRKREFDIFKRFDSKGRKRAWQFQGKANVVFWCLLFVFTGGRRRGFSDI